MKKIILLFVEFDNNNHYLMFFLDNIQTRIKCRKSPSDIFCNCIGNQIYYETFLKNKEIK